MTTPPGRSADERGLAWIQRLYAALAGRYSIERAIGQGGMATVYLAHDLKHHRQVAIKVFRPELAAVLGPDRFLREVEIAARLNHPHILSLYDSDATDGFLYYVMPYVKGESLRHRLDREKQLPIDEALRITEQVAAALSHAHAQGVIHRDVKPENILLYEGEAMVADFGIALAVSAAGGARLTETGLLVGTPPYMSPEQASGGEALDGRSDEYALGCVLYEMLAGEPPFTGPTTESILHQHLVVDAPLVTTIRPAVPRAVAATIQRALSKTPADRFDSVERFAGALRNAERLDKRTPRRRILWLATGTGIVGTALVVGAMLVAPVRPPVAAGASVMVVLPLMPSVPDTALTRLGRDLVVTLSANLDGVGGIRPVDALTILAQTPDPDRVFTGDEAVALARRLGASSVVHGSLLRAGTSVRIDFRLLTIDGLGELARASVTASPADLVGITDSVTWALLRQVWSRGEPPTPSLAAITTQSVPALRAFLEGEAAMPQGRWQAAAQAFERAVAADSAFWLAYARLQYVRLWTSGGVVDTTVLRIILLHRADLPERERLFFDSDWFRQPDSVAMAAMQLLTEKYPDFWPGWFAYGDFLTHNGPLHGYNLAVAQAALERTVTLHPRFSPAWVHVFLVTIARDTTAAARALDVLGGLGYASASTAETGYNLSLLYHLELQRARTGSFDRALLDAIAREVVKSGTRAVSPAVSGPEMQIALSQAVLRARPDARTADQHYQNLALAWAGRGAWDSALAALDDYEDQFPGDGEAPPAIARYELAVIGAWLHAQDPSAALQLRDPAARAADQIPDGQGWKAAIAWLNGILAVVGRDQPALDAARESLRDGDTTATAPLRRSLAAFDQEMRGSRTVAARAMAQLEGERGQRPWKGYAAHPIVAGVNRLAASRWLLAEGDTAQALRLLVWHEGIGGSLSQRVHYVFAAPDYFESAQIEAAQGRRELALEHYHQFLRLYDRPVPALLGLVVKARDAVARLEERAGPRP